MNLLLHNLRDGRHLNPIMTGGFFLISFPSPARPLWCPHHMCPCVSSGSPPLRSRSLQFQSYPTLVCSQQAILAHTHVVLEQGLPSSQLTTPTLPCQPKRWPKLYLITKAFPDDTREKPRAPTSATYSQSNVFTCAASPAQTAFHCNRVHV